MAVKEHFTQVYSEYADPIFRYCFLRVSDRNTALDLTQDIFMKYWDALVRGEKVANDKAFLFTIARHSIIDWYRKKKSISLETLIEDNDGIEEFFLSDNNSRQLLETGAESRFLLDKIDKLPPSSQQIIYLRYVEDLGPKEIANILGVRENTVSIRIHRAIEALRKITGYEI